MFGAEACEERWGRYVAFSNDERCIEIRNGRAYDITEGFEAAI